MNEDTERRLDQLQAAADNAAGHVRNLYISFLVFGLYLAVTVAATTHEQLLRSEPVKLPIVNVELPLFGFYWVAPALYVLLHFNLLIQFSLLASKLHRLDQVIERHVKIASERASRRDLLGLFAFSHMLIGRHHQVSLRFFLRSMIFISVILMPVIVLLFTQFRFLPYHSVATTWAHRSFVLIDLSLILFFWLKIRCPHDGVRNQPSHWLWNKLPTALGTILVVACSFIMAIPGEPLVSRLGASLGQDYWRFFNLSVEETNLVSAWPTKKEIADFGEDIAWQNFGGAISLPERDLRYASFWGSNLAHANLKNADLRFAIFFKANLNGANLSEAKLNPAILRDTGLVKVELYRADLSGAILVKANLSEAYLGHAKLNDADLNEANLSKSKLYRADLTGADLNGADLTEANLRETDLNGANLSEAKLNSANLREADLTGANLDNADLRGTKISGAIALDDKWRLVWKIVNEPTSGRSLQAADLSNANLTKAELISANFDNANLSNADLTDVNLVDAQLTEANLSKAKLNGANFSDADLTGANLDNADLRGAKIGSGTALDDKWRLVWGIINKPKSERSLQAAELSNANLSKAVLIDADLTGANLIKANLIDAKLTKADLSGADLRNVYLSKAELRGAILNNANLRGAVLIDAQLAEANLFDADLTDANLSNAYFGSAKLCRTTMPDQTSCNLDCYDGNRSCPWFGGTKVR